MSFANYLDRGSKRLNREDSTCQNPYSYDITRAGATQGYAILAGSAVNQQYGIGLHPPNQLDWTSPNGATKNIVFKGWLEVDNTAAGSGACGFIISLAEDWDTAGSTPGPGAPAGDYYPSVPASANPVSCWSQCGVVNGSTTKSANDYTQQNFIVPADSRIIVPIMIQGYAPSGDQWNELAAKDLATGNVLPGNGAMIILQGTNVNPTQIGIRYQIWSSVEAGNQFLHT